MSAEKERVYTELDRVRKKCARLKREIKNLRQATDAKENAILRDEVGVYRKALSNIAHRLDNGEVGSGDLRSIVEAALALRGLTPYQRGRIRRLHAAQAEVEDRSPSTAGSSRSRSTAA